MHDSRMMADVAPPGDCAMPKVRGSRMATPLAPPRPGSTPMITPRITPVNISAVFFHVSTTPKPCIRSWISSIALAQPQQVLQRPLGQRHLEPLLEDHVEHRRGADADHGHFPPRVLAQPAHEKGDEHGGGDVD